jgi:hypothetical protein
MTRAIVGQKQSPLYTLHLVYPQQNIININGTREPGKLSRYSDRLRKGRPKGRNSIPGEAKNVLLSMSSRLVHSASYPMDTEGYFPGSKAAGA